MSRKRRQRHNFNPVRPQWRSIKPARSISDRPSKIRQPANRQEPSILQREHRPHLATFRESLGDLDGVRFLSCQKLARRTHTRRTFCPCDRIAAGVSLCHGFRNEDHRGSAGTQHGQAGLPDPRPPAHGVHRAMGDSEVNPKIRRRVHKPGRRDSQVPRRLADQPLSRRVEQRWRYSDRNKGPRRRAVGARPRRTTQRWAGRGLIGNRIGHRTDLSPEGCGLTLAAIAVD